MSKDILVFKKRGMKIDENTGNVIKYKLNIWQPGLLKIIPPYKGYKYIAYWLFYMIGIFKNKHYCAYFLYDKNEVVSSCLVIPSYYKWTFMKSKDVQFTYVMTNNDYKGQGMASKLLNKVLADLSPKVNTFRYVTDSENPASVRVAQKMGFEYCGTAERKGFMKILKMVNND